MTDRPEDAATAQDVVWLAIRDALIRYEQRSWTEQVVEASRAVLVALSEQGYSPTEDLLKRVHERVGLGIDIQTFSQGPVEIRWRRDYGDDGWSDERHVGAESLTEALRAVLDWEDEADAIDDVEVREV